MMLGAWQLQRRDFDVTGLGRHRALDDPHDICHSATLRPNHVTGATLNECERYLRKRDE
jgi:cytochrome oxidase assembly protein ShyY1